MKKQLFALLALLLSAILTVSACNTQDTPAATETVMPTEVSVDLCAPENISAEVEKVHEIMREFDDTALLASNTPVEQLNPTIAVLQQIRRAAEDQPVPPCLITLKQRQLAHMNTVINTLLNFLSGADADALNQGIAIARQQHDEYTLELAKLLGLTVVTAPTTAPAEETPQQDTPPQETPPADLPTAPAPLVITNPGPTTVNLRVSPNLDAANVGILPIGGNAVVLGRTADALWYQIEFPQPGQTAWVYASLVQLSDPAAELPVVAPAP